MNRSLKRREALWGDWTYSAVTLEKPLDVVAKMAYVLANPVAAGLVRRGDQWPGVRSAARQIGGAPLVAKRPSTFFRRRGYLPEEAELQLVVPDGFGTADEFRARLLAAVTELEDAAARRLGEEGRAFLGPAKVRAQKPTARPSTPDARRGFNPRVAARDPSRRVEALGRLGAFADEYQRAWRAWQEGEDGVPFPHGTYLMRVAHGAPCVGAA